MIDINRSIFMNKIHKKNLHEVVYHWYGIAVKFSCTFAFFIYQRKTWSYDHLMYWWRLRLT